MGIRGQSPFLIPPISRAGAARNNGFWSHSQHVWWQNEDTAHLPDHWPDKYGTVRFQPPETYLGQLAYPFRRRGKATPYG